MSLAFYGSAVATGVAQEKTARMAELLLAAVRPSHLLTGKVVGIGVCGVGQLAIAVAAGLIANAAVQSAEIPSTVWVLLPAVLLWFLLGYALYSFAFAAAGALVGRQEDVQFVMLPFSLAILGGYLPVFAAIASPYAWWIQPPIISPKEPGFDRRRAGDAVRCTRHRPAGGRAEAPPLDLRLAQFDPPGDGPALRHQAPASTGIKRPLAPASSAR